MSNIGYATLQVIPSFQGAQAAITEGLSGAQTSVGASGGSAGLAFGGAFKKAVGPLLTAAAVTGGAKFLYDLGGQFDDVFDAIRVGTGATGDALEGLKDDWRSVVATVPADFSTAGQAVADLNTKLGISGAPLQKMSAQFLELSRITGTDLTSNLSAGTDALQSFSIGGGKAGREALDQLYRASQASGVGFAELSTKVAQNGTVLRAAGLSFSESTALVASLGRAGVDAAEVMPGLTRGLAEAAEAGIPAKQFLGDLFDRIKTAPDETTATAIALEVLGARAGPKFAQLIREGKLSFEEMLGQIVNGEDTIRKAGDETADFAEKWQVFKNNVLLALEPIATRVFDLMGTGIEKLSGFMTKHRGAALALAGVIGGALLVAVAAYTASMISAAAATIAATFPILAAVAAAAALVAAVVFLWTNWDRVWTWIKEHPALAAVIAIFAPFIATLVAVVGAVKLVHDNWSTIWPAIQSIAETVWGVLQPVLSAMGTVVRAIGDAAQWVYERFQEAWPTVQSLIETVWGALQSVLSLFGGAVRAIGDAAQWVMERAQEAWPIVQQVIQTAWDVAQVPLGFLSDLSRAVGSAAEFTRDAAQEAWPIVSAAIDAAWSAAQLPLALLKAGIDNIVAGLSWIKDNAGAAWEAFKSAAGTLWETINGPLSALAGVLDRIVGAAKRVKDAIDAIPNVPSVPSFSGPGGPSLGEQIENWPKRAKGGPVRAGQPYWVGEEGVEVFVPDRSGTVIPNHALGGRYVHVESLTMVYEGHDPDEFFSRVAAAVS